MNKLLDYKESVQLLELLRESVRKADYKGEEKRRKAMYRSLALISDLLFNLRLLCE